MPFIEFNTQGHNVGLVFSRGGVKWHGKTEGREPFVYHWISSLQANVWLGTSELPTIVVIALTSNVCVPVCRCACNGKR